MSQQQTRNLSERAAPRVTHAPVNKAHPVDARAQRKQVARDQIVCDRVAQGRIERSCLGSMEEGLAAVVIAIAKRTLKTMPLIERHSILNATHRRNEDGETSTIQSSVTNGREELITTNEGAARLEKSSKKSSHDKMSSRSSSKKEANNAASSSSSSSATSSSAGTMYACVSFVFGCGFSVTPGLFRFSRSKSQDNDNDAVNANATCGIRQ